MLRTQTIAYLILCSYVNCYTMSSAIKNEPTPAHALEITNENQSATTSDSQPAPTISSTTPRKGRKRRRKNNIHNMSYKTLNKKG